MRDLSSFARRHPRGFTLIELLVVIVILAVLLAIAIPAYVSQQAKAKDAKAQQYLGYAYRAVRSNTPQTNNQFPSASSMVSWVQQSEPELTTTSGNCYLPSSLTANTVVVDSSSTSSNLVLCDKSDSGSVWRLTSTPTSAPILSNGTAVPLAVSGNEITDATRAAAVQGDGLSNDSSTGIWEATTNLIENGGFESGTGGTPYGFWSTPGWWGGSAAVSQDTSTSKFGSASMKVVTTGAAGVGWNFSNTHLLVNSRFTFSVWAKGSGTAFLGANGCGCGSDGASFALTPIWTQYTWTSSSAYSGDIYNLTFYIATAGTSTFWIDGAQLEQKAYVTPYVETNDSTATRNIAEVQAPAGLLNATQGWAAFRVRVGLSSAQYNCNVGVSGKGYVFELSDGTNSNRYLVCIQSGTWDYAAEVAGSITLNHVADTFSASDMRTVVFAWGAFGVKLSVGGAPFATAANSLPSGLTTLVFGSAHNGIPLDGDILWAAIGVGTLTDSDAATINSRGDSDPQLSTFPTAAQAAMVWDGTSSTGISH